MMMGGPAMGGPPHLPSMLEPNKPNMENKLTISWMDASWQQILNGQNVMDYFTDRRNPFYDSNSNNEIVKMQNRSHDMLANMTGIEYCLLYVQEPILYVVRKQQRHAPTQVTPISDYYIVAGTIYQAPDLCSVVNSRLLSAVNHLQAAFDEAKGYAKYHPTRGYWWDFQQPANNNTPFGAKKITPPEDSNKKPKKKKKSEQDIAKGEPSSVFQRVRVDYLLKLLTEKFPPPQIKRAPNVVPTPATSAGANTDSKSNAGDDKVEKESIKSEKEESRGIKREIPSSGPRPGSGMDQSKKMKFG